MVARPSAWEGVIGIREDMTVRMMRIVMRRKRLQSQSRRSQGRNHEEEVQVQRREKVSLLGEMMMVDQKDDLDHDQNERNQRDVMRVRMMRPAINRSMRIVGFVNFIIVDFVLCLNLVDIFDCLM